MSTYNFSQYHYRAMNAESEEEKNAINHELKQLYNTLTEEEKEIFNAELQQFLVNEYSKIASIGEQLKNNN